MASKKYNAIKKVAVPTPKHYKTKKKQHTNMFFYKHFCFKCCLSRNTRSWRMSLSPSSLQQAAFWLWSGTFRSKLTRFWIWADIRCRMTSVGLSLLSRVRHFDSQQPRWHDNLSIDIVNMADFNFLQTDTVHWFLITLCWHSSQLFLVFQETSCVHLDKDIMI